MQGRAHIISKNKKRFFTTVVASIAIVTSVYAFVEPYLIKYEKFSFFDKDIPAAFDGKRIVFIADIHRSHFFSQNRLKKLISMVNANSPDIILLGGDYTTHGEPQYIESVFSELATLNAPLGVYAVLGNHDHTQYLYLTKVSIKKANIQLLDNKATWVYIKHERIKIGGVGDLWHDIQTLSPTTTDVNSHDFVILLSHNPDYARTLSTDLVDLVLSGHSHGGQITFFGLWAYDRIYSNYTDGKFRHGLINLGFTQVFVTKGIGTVFLPMRFFARPEIVVITLRKEI